ncbi:hypothetical protein KKJ01_19945 [Xenorhabdus bovienii]|uniref:Uncharacterized protein n=1 Tax=Xenorhabdus bovienii TaxID=40576 RepID=A0AAJ1JBM9_XENBV|nr:hypothetical protein [Xenorhabdus bovienii]MDE1480426.1 hypothetical protein [Xenorhabdus bovienii]MDE9512098.1 hypothetical protein [Xenorhabdus bovienii]MDE9523771.1 hypothetical protein [Xenorhabdus bovienii]
MNDKLLGNEKLLDFCDYEEAIIDILSDLPWQTGSMKTLIEKVEGIVNSYKNCRGDVSTICVYWMLSGWMELGAMKSGEYVPDENDKIEVTDHTRNRLNVIARSLTNNAAKNIASHVEMVSRLEETAAHGGFELIAENLRNSDQKKLLYVVEKLNEFPPQLTEKK